MRKLKLDAEELVVETFDSLRAQDYEKGTVHANATGEWDCPPTNDPRLRQCYTPYVECSTQGYTCAFSCVYCQFPITSDCPAE